MACADVGSTNPDIAGLGIILAFTIQAGLSFFFSIWDVVIEVRLGLQQHRRIKAKRHHDHEFESSDGEPDETPRANATLGLIHGVLKAIGTTQLLNGIALLVGAMAQYQTLGLYHLHIVYDVVNFTGISAAAALNATFKQLSVFLLTGLLILVYMLLYLGFIILFGLKLRLWDSDVSGRCYNAERISAQSASHPYVDVVYLSITAFYFLYSLFLCIVSSGIRLRDFMRKQSTVSSGTQPPKVLEVAMATQVVLLASEVYKGVTWLDAPLTLLESKLNNMETDIKKSKVFKEAMIILQRLKRSKGYEVVVNLPGGLQESRFYDAAIETRQRLRESQLGLRLRGLESQFEEFLSVVSVNGYYFHRLFPLLMAMVQYPVHCYMIWALRASNEPFLSGGSENEWGFGQIVALVLVVPIFLQCVKIVAEHQLWKKSDDVHRGIGLGSNTFLQTLFLGKDDVPGSVSPRDRSKGLARRQSLPPDFKMA